MSAGQNPPDEEASSGSGTNQATVEPHTCDDDTTDARVFVNDVRVPVSDVDIHMRKEGPLSATRYAEGKIASPFNGVDYINAFDAANEDGQGQYDVIRIEVRDYLSDQFVTQFHGLVTGLGNGSGPERIWTFRAQGVGLFFDKVDAGFTVENKDGITADSIAEIITQKINELFVGQPFNIDSVVGNNAGVYKSEPDLSDPEFEQGPDGELRGTGTTTKSFVANRHTLADIVRWLEKTFELYAYVDHVPENPALFAVRDPHAGTHTAHYMGGNLQIIQNDALSELRPVNTLIAKGSAQDSTGPFNGLFSADEPADEYAYAIARHKDLFKRSGEMPLRAKSLEVDARDMEEVKKQARQKLKERIDDTSSGDMLTLPRAPVQPFNLVEAKPTCQESPATNVPAVTYEVHRVHHRIRGGERSTTKLNVGVHTNAVEDLVIDEEGYRDTQ